jgi:ABC-2 type transport system permease protein
MLKYFIFFHLGLIHTARNYKALIGLCIFLMTCLIIFDHLWKISVPQTGDLTFNAKHLLWYIAFNEWILISIPDIQIDMEHDFRSGRLSYLLPRPISYLGSAFAESLGVFFINFIVLGIVSFLFTYHAIENIPFDFSILVINIALGFLAGCVGMIFKMIVGLSAFWLQEVGPILWLWEKLLFMFGGLLLPLSIYPSWIRNIAVWTPFPAILGERSALALDFSSSEFFFVFIALLSWGIIGLSCLIYLYRKGLRIINVEGG